jgi:uncharacterized membrane protein (DUF2068 family)
MKIFLRSLAVIYAFAAVLHIGSILGFGRMPFGDMALSWQLSDIAYSIIDTVAAIGLWQQRRWGVIAFFVAAVSEILLFTFAPEWFTSDPSELRMLRGFIVYHLVALTIYSVLVYRNRSGV